MKFYTPVTQTLFPTDFALLFFYKSAYRPPWQSVLHPAIVVKEILTCSCILVKKSPFKT